MLGENSGFSRIPGAVATISIDGLGVASFRPNPEPIGRRWEVAFLREDKHYLILEVNDDTYPKKIAKDDRIVIKGADSEDHIPAEYQDGYLCDGTIHSFENIFTLGEATTGDPSLPKDPSKLTLAYIHDALFYTKELGSLVAKHSTDPNDDPNYPDVRAKYISRPITGGQEAKTLGGDIICPTGVGVRVEVRDKNNHLLWHRDLPSLEAGAEPHSITLTNRERRIFIAGDFEFYADAFNLQQTHELWVFCPDVNSTSPCGCACIRCPQCYLIYEGLPTFANLNFKKLPLEA